MNKGLLNLGLSDNESKIYLAVLELGPAGAGLIAKQAGVKRPTTYLALDHLIKQGLISQVVSDKEKLFRAEEPDKLRKLTKKMRRKVIEAEIELDKLLPGLKAIQKKLIEAPKVTFYQGIEGFKNIMEDISASRLTWYFFGSSEELLKSIKPVEIDDLMQETDKLREAAGRPKAFMISDKGILTITPFKVRNPKVREIRIWPHVISSRSALAIYGNKVALFAGAENPFGAIIESSETAELVKMMYQIIWQNLPEEK